MTMPDSQRYLNKLFPIKYELDINNYNFENGLFIIVIVSTTRKHGDIKIRISEFAAKTQFLCLKF